MALYDILLAPEQDGKEAQVKLWESRLDTYSTGDAVPVGPDKEDTYVIACREGGFFLIGKCQLICWVPEASDFLSQFPIYNKYGDPYHPEFYRSKDDPFNPENYYPNG